MKRTYWPAYGAKDLPDLDFWKNLSRHRRNEILSLARYQLNDLTMILLATEGPLVEVRERAFKRIKESHSKKCDCGEAYQLTPETIGTGMRCANGHLGCSSLYWPQMLLEELWGAWRKKYGGGPSR